LELGEFVDVEVGEVEPSKTEAVEQLGPLVHVERESDELEEDGQKEMGIVDPDRLLLEKAEQAKDGEKELDGRMEEEGEGEKANGEQEHREETAPQIRQFTGTAALALPPERGQRLDRLDLEVQVKRKWKQGYGTTNLAPGKLGFIFKNYSQELMIVISN
jgi:hypothetical protein